MRPIPLILLALFLATASMRAQSPYADSKSLDATETLRYDLSFRWSFLRGKVGEARLINKPTSGSKRFSQLVFRTTGIGDNVFPMRDTLETLFSAQKLPIRFEKRTHENDFVMNDVINYSYASSRTSLKIKQWDRKKTRVDTTLYLPADRVVADMLSTLALVRTVDYKVLKVGKKHAFTSPDGAKLVQSTYRLTGYSTAKIGKDETVSVLKIAVRIDDPAFQKGNAMEVWLTRDDRLIPVFISARLSLGYAECRLTSYSRN